MLLLIFCFLPFSIVENVCFKDFVSQLNPSSNYKLPCRKTLNKLLQEVYQKNRDYLQEYLSNVKWLHAKTDT